MNKNTWITGWRPAGVPYVEQYKNLLLSRTKSCNKMLELLHLQLIRKGRARDKVTLYHPLLKKYVYFFKDYDIKTPSPAPYNRDSNYDLGLNQYFVGQSPYKTYQGDLKDGIYHDDCEIRSGGTIKESDLSGGYTHYEGYDAHSETSYTLTSFYAWEMVDGYGNFVFLSHPKSYLDGRKYSLIYRVVRATTDIFLRGTNSNYTYYTKVYEQRIINGENKFFATGETSSFSVNGYKMIYDGGEDGSPSYGTDSTAKFAQNYIANNMTITKVNATASYNTQVEDGEGGWRPIIVSYPSDFECETSGGVDLYVNHLGKRIYPFSKSGGYYIMGNGMLMVLSSFYFLTTETYLILYDTFYSDNNMPTRGSFNWYKEWNSHYRLYVNEDNDVPGWIMPIIAIVAVVVSVFTAGAASGAAAAAMGAAGATATATTVAVTAATIGAVAGVMGLAFTLIGSLSGNSGLAKFGKVLGISGAILSVFSAATQMWARVGATAASSASTLSSSSVASSNGLSQTSSLYATTGSANASALGSSMATSTALPGGMSLTTTMNGTYLTSSFYSGLATNLSTGVTLPTTATIGVSSVNLATGSIVTTGIGNAGAMIYSPLTNSFMMPSVFTGGAISSSFDVMSALSMAKDLYKVYNDTRDIFKQPNRFEDDEMPNNDDEAKIQWVPMNTELIKRRHYSVTEDYDLGLEPGTLMYLKSVRDKIK
ncbi:putative membrane protein [Campylobacter iguaniorum]|uniref:hypothetical protein n=1 Tax=Campylobacter iguaniorum TaxID=1244531 RepID=UPI00073A528E|nr:hypothetical protein [Campylobacter iguaniorum]ALV24924.1 putative membrane protein [Campylobacter iguaniorum]